MRRSGARAGQWPHRSTSLAHFKSLQVVLKGFHMPSKSSFPPSYCCTWQMDTVKNFLFESILPFKKTVVNIPCSQNCIGQQSLGGVHPWQVFWDNWQLQDHEVRTFLYWIPSRPFPTVNMQLSLSLCFSLSLNNPLHNRIFWMGTNKSSGSSREWCRKQWAEPILLSPPNSLVALDCLCLFVYCCCFLVEEIWFVNLIIFVLKW